MATVKHATISIPQSGGRLQSFSTPSEAPFILPSLSRKISEILVLVARPSDIKPYTFLRFPIETVALLVLTHKQDMQHECQYHNEKTKTATNSAPFLVDGPSGTLA